LTEVRYRRLFEAAKDGILILDADTGRIVDVNPFLAELLGYLPKELLGKRLWEIGFFKDHISSQSAFEKLRTKDYIRYDDLPLRSRDGRERAVEFVSNVYEVDQRKVIQCNIRDITERKRAETELNYERNLWRTLLDNSPDHIYFKDAQSRFIKSSKAQARQFGLESPDEMVGKTDFDFFTEEHARPAFEDEQEIIRTGRPIIAKEEREVWKDGHVTWASSTKMPMRDTTGKITGIMGISRDITERKQAAEALMQSVSLLRATLESTADGILVVNAAGDVVDFNQQFREMWRLPDAIVATRKDQQLLNYVLEQLADPNAFLAKVTELYQQPNREDFDTLHFKDGRVFERYSRPQRIRDQIVGRVWSFRDITARARTEQALRKSEEKLAKAFQAVPDTVTITRLRDGMMLEFNDRFTAVFGFTRQEALGHSVLELNLWVNPEGRKDLVGQVTATGECHSMEVAFRAKDGRTVPCLLSATGLMIEGESCMLSIIRDISESKRLEDQLRQAQKMEAVGQLAGGVAHDYNNILTAMLIQLGLLLNDPLLAPEVKNSLKELEHAAERATNLTRQLLLFSRRQVIQVKPVDLNEVLADLLKMLRRLLGENISLEFKGRTTPLWIEADAGMMEQVVTNLCLNARDAMTPKGGRLTIDAQIMELGTQAAWENPEARPGIFVCLSVTDTGVGMDAAILSRIFEPFFTTKETGKGTGLGLATVYGITKQHRGWLDVTSRVGQGSTFRVYLPAMREAPPIESESARPEVKRGDETILLVEDEPLVRQMAAMSLRWHGYHVIEAADGPEAIRLWDQHAGEIDLLFSDMVMPGGITGLDLFRRFKQTKANLKAIVSSGYSLELATSNVPPGPDIAFLSKPYEITTLAIAVRKCLDQTQAERTGRSATPFPAPPSA
jgi:two-component system cell cycle sensor histidine kinase/response regulator CckA